MLQAPLTAGWSALLLGERVTASTVLAAQAVIVAVARGRTPAFAVPEE
jgi:hypothetical protein